MADYSKYIWHIQAVFDNQLLNYRATRLSIIYLFFSDTLYESTISLYPAGELSDNNSVLSELSD